MRKSFFLAVFFSVVAVSVCVAEKQEETVFVDNLHSLRTTFDSDSQEIDMIVYSDNSAAFDEGLAEFIVEENLREFMDLNGFSDFRLILSEINSDAKDGAYTTFCKKFKLGE